MILLQGDVSRSESIANLVSHRAWNRGVDTFFRQQVPYSLGTGYLLAEALAKTSSIAYAATDVTKTTPELSESPQRSTSFNSLELGAGMGLLSAHYLDRLKTYYPELYPITSSTVTDYSDTLIEQMDKKGIFSAHKDAVKTTAVHAHLPKQHFDTEKFNLIFFMNTLSALDPVHLEWNAGELNELKVKSQCPAPSQFLFDNSQIPPQPIEFSENPDGQIDDVTRHINELPFPVVEAISENIIEELISVPISQSRAIGETDIQLIRDWMNDRHSTPQPNPEKAQNENSSSPHYFNYPLGAVEMFSQLNDLLDDNGVIVIGDFGFTGQNTSPKPEELITKFGVACAYPLQFDLIIFLATRCGLECALTDFPDRQTQFLVLRKTESSHINLNEIISIFQDVNGQKIEENIQHPEHLSELAQQDTVFCMQRAQLLFDEWYSTVTNAPVGASQDAVDTEHQMHQLLAHAQGLAEKSCRGYEHCCSANLSLLALIHSHKGDPEAALRYLKDALAQTPHLPSLLLEYVSIYAEKNDYQTALHYLKDYLTQARLDRYWEQLCTCILLWAQQGNRRLALSVINTTLANVESQKIKSVPDSVVEKLTAIKAEL